MGKRKGPNLTRLSMLTGYQSRYAMYQDAGFAGSRSSQHQHRPMNVVGGLLLPRVELRIRDSHRTLTTSLHYAKEKRRRQRETVVETGANVEDEAIICWLHAHPLALR